MDQKAFVNGNCGGAGNGTEILDGEILLKARDMQHAILNSANFSMIAASEKDFIQLFNDRAECGA